MTLSNIRIPKKHYQRISAVPPTPLVQAFEKSLKRDQLITLKLPNRPDQASSQANNLSTHLFDTKAPDEVIAVVDNIKKAISGQNIKGIFCIEF